MPVYKPIENYGVIGDLHTVALVGMDGSIDWCCLPHFDSPSIFAALLDARKGGYFKIAPTAQAVQKQMYLPGTCILITRFLTQDGVGEVLDFMPVQEKESELFRQIVRMVRVVKGSMRFTMECFPAFDYARASHQCLLKPAGAIFESQKIKAGLTSPVPLHRKNKGVICEFTLKEGTQISFILRQGELKHSGKLLGKKGKVERVFDSTIAFWRTWNSKIQYKGRWREMIQRSAMTLKLLTFLPTGAVVAAPTTSLPETLGGARNFDYRFTWIRDAAFTISALLQLGLTEEAEHFMSWIDRRAHEVKWDGSLQIMYGLHGEHELKETLLPHLEGYRKSKPVRIGNAAAGQLQLDIYGELLDAIYLSNRHSKWVSDDLWVHLCQSLDYVCKNWRQKDEGIWEVRGGRHHFVYSKVMCWVALDRGIRLMANRGFPGNRDCWLPTRDMIYKEIMARGWNKKKQTFVQHYDTSAVDAAGLILPLVGFIAPDDPKMLSTLKAIRETLAYDSLLHRYQKSNGAAHDGFNGEEGSFSMCTFWLVECLTRAGFLEEARYIFEKMHSFSNHLGLYSEEIGPTGAFLGNYPQALTHMSLITAAFTLNHALGD